MQRIEFLGATGIGKTSLLNIIFSSRTNDDHWLTIDEAKIRIANSMDDDFPALSRRSLMKYGLFKKKHKIWADEILHKYEKPAIETCLPLYYSFINEVLVAFALKNIANPVNKFNHIAYSISLFKKLAFLDYFKKDYAVIFDEFIIHNIPITSDIQLLNKLFEKNDELKTRILPKAIINCKSSLEENYNRRNKRIKSGTILFIDKNLSDENLIMSCKINLEEAEKKAVVMQELGVPVLSVDMEEDQGFNANKVLDFIRKINKT